MCGIAGMITGRDDRRTLVQAMLDRIAHRGPDDEGLWTEDEAALGHRRLSIIDLSPTGHQPMASADGRFVCAFNGEVYNFRELRAELESRGLALQGTSDTEVLVESFALHGHAVFARLRGMFAIAIWDRHERRLTLARDHFGKKPLYYSDAKTGSFVFASEVHAIAAVADTTINTRMLAAYFHFAYFPEPETVYDEIRALPPGHWATWSRDEGLASSPYWTIAQLPADEQAGLDLDDLDAEIRRAVERRLQSDVTLGCFLSGGVDSTLVASYVAELRPGFPSVTVGFESAAWDESPRAAQTAAALDTTHFVEIVSIADSERLFNNYIAAYDQPFADSSAIPTMVLCESARRHMTVALGGDGADEVFAGYDRYGWLHNVVRAQRTPAALRGTVGGLLAAAGGSRGARVARLLRTSDAAEAYEEIMRVWHASDIASLFIVATDRPRFNVGDAAPAGGLSPQRIDLLNYLPFDILVKVDRASMRYGLEARCPYLDVDLIHWAASRGLLSPTSYRRRKTALKQLLQRRVPSYDTTGRKRGFAMPIADWLAGPLHQRLQDLTAAEHLHRQGYFAPDAVRSVVARFNAGDRALAFPLWSLLVFQEWHEKQGRDAP